jgi:hypothetical protein
VAAVVRSEPEAVVVVEAGLELGSPYTVVAAEAHSETQSVAVAEEARHHHILSVGTRNHLVVAVAVGLGGNLSSFGHCIGLLLGGQSWRRLGRSSTMKTW